MNQILVGCLLILASLPSSLKKPTGDAMQCVNNYKGSVKIRIPEEIVQYADDLWTSMDDRDKEQIQKVQSAEPSQNAKLLLYCFAALRVEYGKFEDAFAEALLKFYSRVPETININRRFTSYSDYCKGDFKQHCRQIYSSLYASNEAHPGLIWPLQNAEEEVVQSARILARLQGASLIGDVKNPLFRQAIFLFHSHSLLFPSLFNNKDLLDPVVFGRYFRGAEAYQATDQFTAFAPTVIENVVEWKKSLSDSRMISANDDALKVCLTVIDEKIS